MKSIKIGAKDNAFVLTGAGISVESGLPAFRSEDGLWAGHRTEDVCTPEAWDRDSWKVWKFYSERREQALKARPNPGHVALAEIGQKLGDRLFLCTQNVDSLHEQAGSTGIAHMHGSLFESRCEDDNCNTLPVSDLEIYKSLDDVSRCVCGAMLRPNIVFFGEIPMELTAIERALEKATVLLAVGTSGTVTPAAHFVREANKAGARTIYVGLEPPANASHFSEIYLGSASALSFEIRD